MARYDSERKLERNLEIVAYVTAHPDLALSEIAPKFGLSRARIGAILKSMARRERKRDVHLR